MILSDNASNHLFFNCCWILLKLYGIVCYEVNIQLQEVNDICKVSIEIMSFDKETEEELSKMPKHSGIKFWFYYGYIVMFDKVNIHAITPHMLVFCKNGNYLVVLHYDEYHEDDDLFFVDGNKYTLLTIKKYIRNYFKNNSNINGKINNK